MNIFVLIIKYSYTIKEAKIFAVENKTIRRNLYRVLRKTGVQKKDIFVNASFSEDLGFDNTDWSIFTFYLENIFKINLKDEEIKEMHNINDTLILLKNSA